MGNCRSTAVLKENLKLITLEIEGFLEGVIEIIGSPEGALDIDGCPEGALDIKGWLLRRST